MRRGMCGACYKRWLNKQPGSLRKPLAPATERFWPNVDKNGPIPANRTELGPCWVWTGYQMPNGYGQFYLGGQARAYAHRWAWEEARGRIVGQLTIDHLCLNRPCVNPSHMELVTRGENTRRGQRKVQCEHCDLWLVPANLGRHFATRHARMKQYTELRASGASKREARERVGIAERTAARYEADMHLVLLGEAG